MPRSLIITADDYGMTVGINRGIDACVLAKVVKSVSVMPNMAFWREIGSLASTEPAVSVGIHWTVTQGRPVLPAREVQSLVDEAGEFLPPNGFRARFKKGGVVMRELQAELEAQVVRLREVVPAVAFWNTHQNIHVTWGLYQEFVRIGGALGITAMRSHQRLLARRGRSSLAFHIRHPMFWLKGLVLRRWAAGASRQGFALPTSRIVLTSGGSGAGDLVAQLRETAWDGAAELVTHPSASLDGLRGITTLVESRVAEFQELSASALPAKLTAQGIRLVSFASVMPVNPGS